MPDTKKWRPFYIKSANPCCKPSAFFKYDDKGINIYSHKALTMVGSEINFNAPIISVKAKLGEINMLKLDPQFPLVTSSFTMSNQSDMVSKGGTELVGRDFVNYLAFEEINQRRMNLPQGTKQTIIMILGDKVYQELL